jgi:glutamate dehydrogenase (NAD(P)+)
VRGFDRAIDRGAFLATRADIFIPAAAGGTITAETAPLLDVRLVAEGANGPTDPEGDAILADRGIPVLPDILGNAGGVVVSYFEWLQNRQREAWELETVDRKLQAVLLAAYDRVRDAVRELKTDWRTAAYTVALRRLEAVYLERGIFP